MRRSDRTSAVTTKTEIVEVDEAIMRDTARTNSSTKGGSNRADLAG